VDACDDVMEKMGYPKGLIRYTTENALEGRKTRVLRPRVLIYGLILLALLSAVAYGIATRVPLDLDVIRDRNTLYRQTSEGLVENVYVLKLLNMDRKDHDYTLSASGLPGVVMKMDDPNLEVPAGEVREASVRLQIDPYDLKKPGNDVFFVLTARDDPSLTVKKEARFVGPGK
jgi:polyferredoxin